MSKITPYKMVIYFIVFEKNSTKYLEEVCLFFVSLIKRVFCNILLRILVCGDKPLKFANKLLTHALISVLKIQEFWSLKFFKFLPTTCQCLPQFLNKL